MITSTTKAIEFNEMSGQKGIQECINGKNMFLWDHEKWVYLFEALQPSQHY